LDGTGTDKGSFIQVAGKADSVGTYLAHATMPTESIAFVSKYQERYDAQPAAFTAGAYACVEVIVQALRAIAKDRPTASGLREALRAYAVNPNHRYDTVLSDVRFDDNGDAIHQIVEFYRVDPLAANGAGDWVAFTQHDYGPPPP
jgi:ABC-type branched-subunit amino acid transport system substrate-binding protein